MRRHFAIALLTLAGCAPSATRRQCEFIKSGGLMPVASRYKWAGYYDCQRDKALIPVLVKNRMETGLFDFKSEKVTHLVGPEHGESTIGGGHLQWLLSPNTRYAIWIETRMEPIYLLGPTVKIYDIPNKKQTEVALPEREAIGTLGGWNFKEFSPDGNALTFELFGKKELAVIDLNKGQLSVMKAAPN